MWNELKKNKILLVLTIFVLMVVTYSFARFIYDEIKENFFMTEKFYFNSDKLKEESAVYQINNYNGVDQYNITINLNSLKNNLLGATTDIEYDISYNCSLRAVCGVSKETSTIYESTNTDSFIASITPTENLYDQDVIWIEVTASANSPFEKELSATFALKVGYYGLSHEISDEVNDPYFEAKITNTLDYYRVITPFGTYSAEDRISVDTYLGLSDIDKEKCASSFVTLSFDPNVVLLDLTDKSYIEATNTEIVNIGGNDYIDEITFKIDAISSVIVRFYKKDANLDYTFPITNPTSIIDVVYH